MSLECGYFFPFQCINLDGFVPGPCGNIFIIYEENAQNRFLMIRDNSFNSPKAQCLPPFNCCTSLGSTHLPNCIDVISINCFSFVEVSKLGNGSLLDLVGKCFLANTSWIFY